MAGGNSVNEQVKLMYLGTTRELESKAESGDYYSLVKASGLLRGLIMDGGSLLDAANREFRLKFTFEIVSMPNFAGSPQMVLHSIVPTKRYRPEAVALAGLLPQTCIIWDYQKYSVRDVIRACANAKGGVHIGKAAKSEQGILDMDEVVRIGGEECSLRVIRDIIAVVLKGIEPLTAAIENQTK